MPELKPNAENASEMSGPPIATGAPHLFKLKQIRPVLRRFGEQGDTAHAFRITHTFQLGICRDGVGQWKARECNEAVRIKRTGGNQAIIGRDRYFRIKRWVRRWTHWRERQHRDVDTHRSISCSRASKLTIGWVRENCAGNPDGFTAPQRTSSSRRSASAGM